MASTAHQLEYRIGMVSRLTGVSVHTLRVWERRHEVVTPRRTAGGDRIYDADDVARLSRVAELVHAGHAVSTVARLSDDQLEALRDERLAVEARAGGAHDALIEEVVQAVMRLDHRQAERLLGRALLALEPDDFIFEVVSPLLRVVGERWHAGTLEIYHEHLLSGLVRGLLVSMVRNLRPQAGSKSVVIATPQGERHEFGALIISTLVAHYGWTPIYLGIDLPAEDIVATAERSGARVLLLSVIRERGEAIQAELSRIEETLDPEVRLIVGGAAAHDLTLARAELVEGPNLKKRLAELERA